MNNRIMVPLFDKQAKELQQKDDEIFTLKKQLMELTLSVNDYKRRLSKIEENPLVDPDNNLCERKARILMEKINQAISLRSQDHLTDYCDCLGVIDLFAADDDVNLYKAIKYIFKRPRIKISKVKSP